MASLSMGPTWPTWLGPELERVQGELAAALGPIRCHRLALSIDDEPVLVAVMVTGEADVDAARRALHLEVAHVLPGIPLRTEVSRP